MQRVPYVSVENGEAGISVDSAIRIDVSCPPRLPNRSVALPP